MQDWMMSSVTITDSMKHILPAFVFEGRRGDLVKVHFPDKDRTELGIMKERSSEYPNSCWIVGMDGFLLDVHQDALEVVSKISGS